MPIIYLQNCDWANLANIVPNRNSPKNNSVKLIEINLQLMASQIMFDINHVKATGFGKTAMRMVV